MAESTVDRRPTGASSAIPGRGAGVLPHVVRPRHGVAGLRRLVEFVEVFVVFHQVDVAGRLRLRRGAADVRPSRRRPSGSPTWSSATSTSCRRTSAPAPSTRFCCGRCRPLGQLVTQRLLAAPARPRRDRARRRWSSRWSPADIDWTPARVALLVVVTPLARRRDLQRDLRGDLADRLLGGRGHGVRQRVHLRRQLPVVVPVHRLRHRGAAAASPSRCRSRFVAYLPTLALLGRPDPLGLPGWLSLVAGAGGRGRLAVAPALIWRTGAPATTVGSGLVIVECRTCVGSSSYAARPAGCRRTRHVISAVDGVSFARRAGRVRRLHRRQRRRQVDHHQDAHRHPGADRPGRCGSAGSSRSPSDATLARRIGVVFGQRTQLWWDLPLRESFRCCAAIHRLPADAHAAATGRAASSCSSMGAFLDTPVRQLSLGQRMRGEIDGGPAARPRAAGPRRADDRARRGEQGAAAGVPHPSERGAHGTTLLLTTHDLRDIERLCDRVLVVDHGRLVVDGTAARAGQRRSAPSGCSWSTWPSPAADLTDVPHTTLRAVEADGLRQRLAFEPEETTAAEVSHAVAARVDAARPDRRRARHRGRRPPDLPVLRSSSGRDPPTGRYRLQPVVHARGRLAGAGPVTGHHRQELLAPRACRRSWVPARTVAVRGPAGAARSRRRARPAPGGLPAGRRLGPRRSRSRRRSIGLRRRPA